MSEAEYIQRLPEKALDALYDSLSVQTMPEGRYDGRAWIYGHPVLGWLASFVWRGKVFYPSNLARGRFALNRICGFLLVRGDVWPHGSAGIAIYYFFGLIDTVRQVSPTLYLGRMQWRSIVVHFTLKKTYVG